MIDQVFKDRFPNVQTDQWIQLEHWSELLRDWNAKINLISRKDIDYLECRHLAHCLAITNHLELAQGATILDVGTGGGFPGIPMAICYPQAKFTLIDSIGKKIKVVQDLADRLDLRNVDALQYRAESVKQEFDFITGRAVKNLPEFFGWIRRNLKRGQRHSLANGVLYWKGGELEDEYRSLGFKPHRTIELQKELADPFFENKYILHFDARDVKGRRR